MLKSINSTVFLYLVMPVFCILLISCQEKNTAASEQSYQEKKALSFSENLKVPDNQVIQLLPGAAKESAKWIAYITAQAEVKRFKKFTVQDAVDHAATLKEIMNALSETVPETFQVKPVLSRINVLVTLSSVLQQTANNPEATAEEVEITAKKIPVAFRNLKIQLNEVFRKGLEDFQLELEKMDTIEKNEATIPVLTPKPKES